MPITSLEIKDKTFSTRFRGFDPEEVDEFLDIVVRDYEDLVRSIMIRIYILKIWKSVCLTLMR